MFPGRAWEQGILNPKNPSVIQHQSSSRKLSHERDVPDLP
ncbi:hypothetical protein RISK_000125 [Rhodopirellula islandica]|uniref:Uncharacterized protein n=1 Tax=Rhodopirellula islandica TaxID=595434 RepID=A0A0J1BN99_RHOIS|nr:hypothetical protein RISK_000125 [Rhodopirellula islandica]